MTRLLALTGLAWVILTGSALAQGDTRPVLRSNITTLSDIVTIGDFYSSAGDFADVPLFRSPDLGTTGNVPAEIVSRRAKAAGLEMAGTDGLRTVAVHRRAEVYDAERLEDLAKRSLAERNASLSAEDLEITFYRSPETIQADPTSDTPIVVERVLWSQNDGRFTLYLNVAGARGAKTISLTGHAREMINVISLSQPVRRGTILKAEDLTTVRIPRIQVPANAVMDVKDIAGLAARNNLRAQTPLARNDFERPVLIARNDKVTITFELPGMRLTTRGQAIVDGAKGDVIDIMNLESRRIIPATVTSRGQVRVASSNSIIASLNGGTQ
ncbi:flagellar basal body P-ring formation chaperone FlgA [Roseibium algae]|uniref:Flagellar basal body P-ring formation chaperone FlgA n=1 Tax=Roseibium algae TaxID=3123038 RepID=A0ABU8TMM2_9HYPH